MSKFTGPILGSFVDYTPKRPTAAQIAATGRALPEGQHTLSDDQQRAWFGGVVFMGAVQWDGDAFVCKEERITPQQVATRAAGGSA